MGHSLQRLRIFYCSAAALTVVGLVLRVLSLLLAFDREIGYFTRGAFCPVLLYAVEVVSVLAFLLLPLLYRKERPPKAPPSSHIAELCGRVLAAVAATVASAVLFFYAGSLAAPTVIPMLAALLLLLGLIYLLLPVFGLERQGAQLGSGYALILAAALLLSVTYFDRYTQMNAPHKLGQHLALLSVMLVLLQELRCLIGRALPHAHAALRCTAFFLCTVVGGSNVIAMLCGVYRDPVYFVIDLFLLGFGIYLATGARCWFRSPCEEACAPDTMAAVAAACHADPGTDTEKATEGDREPDAGAADTAAESGTNDNGEDPAEQEP